MRIARSASAWLVVVVLASRAQAQVSCANPDNLCTGDPCVMTNIDVQSPCTVDFGARTLRISGILRVPDGGSLSLTAATIIQQGPIDGRHTGNGTGTGAAITLIASATDLEARGEIDVAGTVATGSISLQAPNGNILVKDNLIAKPAGSNITAVGGSVAVEAGGTVTTDQTAVIDAQGLAGGGGSVFLDGDAGVTVSGRVIAEGNPGGTIIVSSDAGTVTLERDLRVFSTQGTAGMVFVIGETGVVVDDKIRASSETALGGTVQILSNSGDVTINDQVNVSGPTAGSITISALSGSVVPRSRLNARASTGTGGAIAVVADTITIRKDLEVRSSSGSGGDIGLTATTLLDMMGGDAEAAGKVDGGSVLLAGGTIMVGRGAGITASGFQGNGGSLTISAPTGSVSFESKVVLTGGGATGLGGQAQVDAAAISISRTRFDADGHLSGGELRFNQSGAGTFLLDGSFEARDDGTIEAKAPAGNLTARGKFRARTLGCIGLSAGGVLDTTGVASDVALSATCP